MHELSQIIREGKMRKVSIDEKYFNGDKGIEFFIEK